MRCEATRHFRHCFDSLVSPTLTTPTLTTPTLTTPTLLQRPPLSPAARLARAATPIAARLARARCERSRVAACRLTLELYADTAAPDTFLLRGVATRVLVQSPEPSLRFAAVTALQRLAQRTRPQDLEWLVLLCDTAANDDDTIVRRGGFEFCLRVLHRLPFLFDANKVGTVQPLSGVHSFIHPCIHPFIHPFIQLSMDGSAEEDIDLHLMRCKIVSTVQRLLEDDEASVSEPG